MEGERLTTRFAPSPTGRLHLGNVRTALFNWLLAQRARGHFLLRIEDTDAARSSAEATEALVADLRWLGLEWDQGYALGGPRAPYRQSERKPLYARYYRALVDSGHAYPCFCSPAELAAARRRQRAAGQPPRYPGTCAGLAAAEADRRTAEGRPAALRFRVPPERVIEIEDLVRGRQIFATDAIGDFIVRRAEGDPAFFFCNAVDDATMGVTHVLRGEDHLSNTPRQVLVLEALGLPIPRYGHMPLILDQAGKPLSKREGSLSVAALRIQGFLPQAIHNTLARLGHRIASAECLDLEGLAAAFALEGIGRAPARFDPGQLDHWQRRALDRGSPEGLWAWMGEEVRRLVPEPDQDAFVAAIRGNALFPSEALGWARIIYEEPPPLSEAARETLAAAGPGYIPLALQALAASSGDFGGFIARLRELCGLRSRRLFLPLRAAMTGRLDGPELAALFMLMGPERLRERLSKLQ